MDASHGSLALSFPKICSKAVDSAQIRTFQDDIRVKSVWSYGGQVPFKLQDSETVYKAKSLSDTYDSLVKH